MRYLRLHTLGFAALLVALTVIHCLPTEAQADRRRRPWTTYGSDRGRLVVACDMTSDTCSDGRRITTQRATPVPCETSPGVWEMVPADQGCYSVRGLESWAQNTSYLSWGAELDRSPWVVMAGSQLSALPEGGYRLCQTGTDSNTGLNQTYSAGLQEGEWATVAVIARPNTASAMLLGTTTGQYNSNLVMTGQDWRIYSYSARYDGNIQRVHIYPRPGGQQLCIDLLGAWLTKSETPGRACWGGEAPVTCAADRHTISTEGWPTESGEISLVYTPQDVGIGTAMYLAATTASGEGLPSGFYLYRISASGALVFGLRRGDTLSGQNTQELVWEQGRSYHVRVRWSPERAEIWRDGVLLRSWVPALVPDSHPGTAVIGTHPSGTNPAQGAIRSLTVRSYEEVSP